MDNVLLTMLGASTGVGALYYLKSVPQQVYRWVRKKLVFTATIYQYDDLYVGLEKYFSKYHQAEYKDVEATIISDRKRRKLLVFNQEESLYTLVYKDKRLFVRKAKEKMEKAMSSKDFYFRKFVIWGWKAKPQISDLLHTVKNQFVEEKKKNEIKIWVNNAWGEWRLSSENKKVKGLDRLFYPNSIKEKLLKDCDQFSASEDRYVELGITYKRGYAFYGPPGTGKTTLSLAVADHLNRDVYSLNLGCLDSDKYLVDVFDGLQNNSLLLIEDIDKFFDGRTFVGNAAKALTFSTFLNCLDGAYSKDGIIVVITTNYIDKLDSALLRAGRLDLKIEIPNPGPQEISEYISFFFKEKVVILQEYDLPMSEIQNVCLGSDNPAEAIRKLTKKRKLVETY